MLQLHKYQQRAVEFHIDVPRSYGALDLGMGKTAVALTMISRLKQPAIVFGPLRTIYSSWPVEIKKWAPHLSYYICHGPKKSLHGLEDCDIILTNYESIKWIAKQTVKWRKRIPIFDEASMLKSHSTQRFNIFKKADPLWLPHMLELSATPAPNSLADLWSQYYLLDRGAALGKNITAFRNSYCRSFSYPGMTVTLYRVDPRFHNEIYERVAPITYRLDAKDYLDMPPITYNNIECELPKGLQGKYAELENSFFLDLDQHTSIEAANSALLSMKLRQFVQGGIYDEDRQWHHLHQVKLEALKELVETSAGQPILCAIQFKGELKAIRDAFGQSIPLIAGGTSATQAARYIEDWNRGLIPLLLCHPASLSHGVNLQAGGHILLWYGLPWSLEQYLQLNGRLYRQGQKSAVFVHHLVMRGTVDEAVMKALQYKDATQQSLLTYLKAYRNGTLNSLLMEMAHADAMGIFSTIGVTRH